VGVFDASTSPLKEGYAVTETNVFQLSQPGTFVDPLTEVLADENGFRPSRPNPRWQSRQPSVPCAP
jgi:hypothetical protein